MTTNYPPNPPNFDRTFEEKRRFEAHKLKGFLRFRETENGVFYSWFVSDYDVLSILVPHFMRRFATQKFVIHDVTSAKMAYFDGENVFFKDTPAEVEVSLSEQDVDFEKLWRQYTKNIAVEGRTNPKQQHAYCNSKYRQFMNEFD